MTLLRLGRVLERLFEIGHEVFGFASALGQASTATVDRHERGGFGNDADPVVNVVEHAFQPLAALEADPEVDFVETELFCHGEEREVRIALGPRVAVLVQQLRHLPKFTLFAGALGRDCGGGRVLVYSEWTILEHPEDLPGVDEFFVEYRLGLQ